MSTVQEIQSAIQNLSREEMNKIHEWLEDFLEDQLVFNEKFESQIVASEREMAEGKRPRVRQP